MNQKTLDKLKKLILMERSARRIGSIKEAELFAQKIQAWLDEHNMSMSDIEIDEQKKDVDQEKVLKDFKHTWKQTLVRGIADVNGCKAIYDPPSMLIVGSSTDRAIVLELYNYFAELGEYLAIDASKEERKQHGSIPPKFRGSFMLGYSVTLSLRLYKAHKEFMEEKAKENTSTALIYIGNKLAIAQEFVDKHIPTKKYRPNYNINNDDGYEKGQKAGNSVALTNKLFTKD